MASQLLLSQCLSMPMGAGFGLLLSSAAAIVLSFVLPAVWSILGNLVTALHTAAHGWTVAARWHPARAGRPHRPAVGAGRL